MSNASSVDHPRHRRPPRRTGRRTLLLLVVGVTAALAIPTQASAAGSTIVGLAGKCLTDKGSSSANKNPIVLATCNGSTGQSWSKPGNGTITALGKCLDARFGGLVRGTPVQLYSCNGSGAQQWVAAGKNLRNPQSGLCLDVTGNNSAEGTRIQLWTCVLGQANQSWTGGAGTTAPGGSWRRDFYDGFDGALNSGTWGKYGYGGQKPGHGGMGVYGLDNVFTSNGNLVMRTKYSNGTWSSAGMSGARGFSASQGKWEVRARFDKAKGIGFAFLLYPSDGSWPPELDIIEGHPNGPKILSTFHWGATNNQIQKWHEVWDMTNWHTYGVIMQSGKITYTMDGTAWASFASSNVPTKKMWFGIQTAARRCPDKYECVPGNVPNSQTPSSSTIQVDWVAHYAAG